MPERSTTERAKRDAKQGKSASTQAGEFVREEIHHVREGKHGARSAKQAIAIGLSKARQAGVGLPPAPGGKSTAKPKHQSGSPSPRRSAATLDALRKEPHSSVSKSALSKQTHQSAAKRTAADRSAAAKKAAHTRKGSM
jgi:uncharacterized protein DUF6496